MTTYFENIRDFAAKRATYKRTVAEIRSMPVDVALDLGIFPGDARAIAHRAVYGA